MMKGKAKKIDINGWIERYSWWIGGLLLALIIVSGGFLFWKQNQAPSNNANDTALSQLEARVDQSEARIQQLEGKPAISEQPATNPPPATVETGEVAGAATSKPATQTTAPQGKISLNSATATELDSLPGIGAAYAARIIEYRTAHEGFSDIGELKNIKGIGDKTFDKLKDLVTI